MGGAVLAVNRQIQGPVRWRNPLPIDQLTIVRQPNRG